MASRGSTLVHSDRDEFGLIEVVDDAATRTLYFGTEARQTSMFLANPNALALSYTHCMMAGLLFARPLGAALVLGLGGGALVRFLAHHFPSCRLEAVEKRPKVVGVARRFFGLPVEPALCVHVAEAGGFLRAHDGLWDLLLVDIHDPEGMALDVHQQGFFALCRERLAEGGVFAINLWSGGRQDALKQVMRRMRLAFEGGLLYLPVASKHNCIGLGLAGGLAPGQLPVLEQRAAALEPRLGFPLRACLQDLVRSNAHVW
jgi:spermidine synthase